ncbi:MAG: hypothetical protein ABID79_03045 [Elusimicrobiota bacterium]
MSESIYLLSCVVFFVVFDNILEKKLKPVNILYLTLLAAIPIYIRIIGITVPISLALYFIIKKRVSIFLYTTLLLVIFLAPLFIWWHPSTYYEELNKIFLLEFVKNIYFYSSNIFNIFFSPLTGNFSPIKSTIGFFILFFIAVGLYDKKVNLIQKIYFIIYLIFIMFVSYKDMRYLHGIVPWIILFAFLGVSKVLKTKFLYLVTIPFALLFFVSDIKIITDSLTKKTYNLFFPKETYFFMKTSIPKEDKIISSQAGASELYTGIKSYPFGYYNFQDDDLYYNLLKERINYILFFSPNRIQIGVGTLIPILSVKEIANSDARRYLPIYLNMKESTKIYKVIPPINKENYIESYEEIASALQLIDLKDFSKAEKVLIKIVKKEPSLVKARNILANVCILQNKLFCAEKELLLSTKINPDYPMTFAILGQLYFFNGDKIKSKEFYEQALLLADKRYDFKLSKNIKQDLMMLKNAGK